MARILVVDDDPDILKLSERVLADGDGHIVYTATEPMQAMQYLDSLPFDLLISDANMPHYSGYDLVRTLRNNHSFKNLLVAMLTGRRQRKDIERAIQVGVDDYIVKPIDPLILIQKVTALLEKKAPERQAQVQIQEGPLAQVRASLPITMESVSELGVIVRTSTPMSAGQTVDLSGGVFDEIGGDIPPLKVLSADRIDGGDTRAQLVFLGPGEQFLMRVRKWMLTHGSLNRATG